MSKPILSSLLATTLLGGLALSFSSPVGDQEFTLEGNPGQGRRVFVEKSCVECHAIMGSGGKLGPDLAVVGKGRSFHRLATKMWEHLPLMLESFSAEGIEWPELSTDQMKDLIAYLFYLNYFDRPGDFVKGKQAFADKRCDECHSIGGSSSSQAPQLDDYAASASPLKMVTAMWNHGPAMVQTLKNTGIEIPVFEGSEIADILAYLQGSTVNPMVQKSYLTPGDPALGREVYINKQCNLCHKVRGEGEGDGPDLAEAELNKGVSAIAGILWNHGPMMWEKMADKGIAIKPFSVGQMTDLLAYLYFIGYFPPDGKWKKGRTLFRTRGCEGCHPAEETEGAAGPPQSEIIPLEHSVSLASALWNHGPMMDEQEKTDAEPWPSFTESEMRDLCVFLEGRWQEEEAAAGSDG